MPRNFFSLLLFFFIFILFSFAQEEKQAQKNDEDILPDRVKQLETQVKMLTQEVLELRKSLQTQQQLTEKISQNTKPQEHLYDSIIADLQRESPENQLTKFYHQLIQSQVWIGGYLDIRWQDIDVSDNKDSIVGKADENSIWELSCVSLQARMAWNDTFSLLADIQLLNTDEISIAHLYFVAALDDYINFKAGVLRIPLGRRNSLYATPLLNLSAPSLTQEILLPNIWSEPGIAIFGKLQKDWLTYEVVASSGFGDQGFSNQTGNSKISQKGWRGYPSSQQIAGRIGFSPSIGTETLAFYTGISGLIARHDNKLSYHALAADALLQIGPFSGIGDHDRLFFTSEYIIFQGHNQKPSTEKISCMYGYYAEATYSFFPENWRQSFGFFTPETELGFSFRYDFLTTSQKSFLANQSQYTLGFHFRPIEPTILRLEYSWLDAQDSWKHQIIASFSTYF